MGLRWGDLVIPEYPTPDRLGLFVEVANKLIMGTGGTPTIPMFIGQGDVVREHFGPGDGVMLAGDVRTLARNYCAKGVPVEYKQYLVGHIGTLGLWLPDAIGWIRDRFAEKLPPNNCTSIKPGDPLDPIPPP